MKNKAVAWAMSVIGVLFLLSILINFVTTGSGETGLVDVNGDSTVIGKSRSDAKVEIPPYELKPGETYPHRIQLVESEFLQNPDQIDLDADWHFTRYELRSVRLQGKEYGTEPLGMVSFRGQMTVTTTDGDNFLPLVSASPTIPADVISAYFEIDVTKAVPNEDTFTVSMPFEHRYEVRVMPVYDVYQFEIWERPYFSDPQQVGTGEVKLPSGHLVEGWDLGV
ncbi:hypothetical protein CBW65_00770 [Tumebacillus avium]|uniref:Uncharacterized protein n=1 Tax=Tumebacillus avium TaxID=1903704 RepID=A0A1Y0II27_9BACL|nr:hypothetical protein [Tumebacillus avium]ARU59739.1 hypothetical protein CBW65_00770 [Tumebacillus avium]